jgi:hypothetical protein
MQLHIMVILKVRTTIHTTVIAAKQRIVRYSGTKYLTHRITYQSYYGDIIDGGNNIDISHILYLGINTARNINPRHLTQESNIINQTRKACALFFGMSGSCSNSHTIF